MILSHHGISHKPPKQTLPQKRRIKLPRLCEVLRAGLDRETLRIVSSLQRQYRSSLLQPKLDRQIPGAPSRSGTSQERKINWHWADDLSDEPKIWILLDELEQMYR